MIEALDPLQGVELNGFQVPPWSALAAVTPAPARDIIVLARDEYSRISDSVTLDVLTQLLELCRGERCVHQPG